MMNKIVVGNLKMWMDTSDVSDYLKAIQNLDNNYVIVCPTSIYVPYFLKRKFKVGLQDISEKDLGSYTGEVCAKQAMTMGIHYALIGHNERRLVDTDEVINEKIKACKKYNLTSILCIGESLKQHKYHQSKKVLKNQLKKALMNVGDLDRIIIAYEPIWSIGTNNIPSVKEISETVQFIKTYVEKHFHSNIRVLYGGSVNVENILMIRNIEEIDGILVGDASTRASEFLDIIDAFFIRQN